MESTQVVIVGGGATGAGILWDLSLRGISAVLLEQGDIANGATGRCHGLLHSGGRYAVKDPESARDCAAENRIVRTIAPHCVDDTGGLFVQTSHDDPAFFQQWWRAAEDAGIPSRRIGADEARSLEPNLAEDTLGAFTCQDAHVDVFRLVLANLEAAAALGGRARTYCKVSSIETTNGRACSVRFRDMRTGEESTIRCDVVVNAAGAWAQSVAALAGVELPLYCDKGVLLVLNHRLSQRVINRCRKPSDGDIVVPAGPVCILGTSSMGVPGPEGLTASQEEIEQLLRQGDELIPGLAKARVLRVFCGVRPLHAPTDGAAQGSRTISRGFALFDHETESGVRGLVSIIGGKLTTYRLMAAAVCDLVAKKLGVHSECQTASTPLRPAVDQKMQRRVLRLLPQAAAHKVMRRLGPAVAHIVKAIEAQPELSETICECEMVTRAELNYVLGKSASMPAKTIADVGRRTRLGFGPCQGTFCGYRAMLAGFQTHRWSAGQAATELAAYLDERGKGQSFIRQGKQVEQFDLCRSLYDANGPVCARSGESDGE